VSDSSADPAGRPRDSDGAVRRAAAGGAILASLLLVAIAAVEGQLDRWLLVGAAAVTLSALVVAGRDRSQQIEAGRPPEAPSSRVADALLANIPDPAILVSRRAIVIEANEAAHALLPGLKARHPLSFGLRSPDVLGGVEEVLRTGLPVKVEYAERIPTERTFEVQIAPLKSDHHALGMQAGVVLFFRDQTSARRLENMRVDFVANASHELRTPLASLLGFIETLQGPARHDDAARDRFLEIMRGQAQRMTRLIDDLLSLSRIEMRAHVAPRGIVDLAPIVGQIGDALAPLAREGGVVINLDLPENPLWVPGDHDELLRVAENLIENAVKYGESGGRVDVTLASVEAPEWLRQETELLAELSVRDYGPGIAPEHLPRLTERFYRVNATQSREKGGTGLGLAIVKHIVNRHRGQLAIESEPGHGAVFKVTLPARASPAKPARAAPP
jgi:two-component system phosphate regulon sensor histidine kinase PhoR